MARRSEVAAEIHATVAGLRVQVTGLQLLLLALLPTLTAEQRAALDERLDHIENMQAYDTTLLDAHEVQERLAEWAAMMRGALHGA